MKIQKVKLAGFDRQVQDYNWSIIDEDVEQDKMRGQCVGEIWTEEAAQKIAKRLGIVIS